jgi:hypothetical protein
LFLSDEAYTANPSSALALAVVSTILFCPAIAAESLATAIVVVPNYRINTWASIVSREVPFEEREGFDRARGGGRRSPRLRQGTS